MPGKILLIGFGNPGRLDDGLGPACAEAVAALELDGVTVDSDYQLTVEDAAAAAEHEVVIFADASVNGKEPFSFERVEPAVEMSFSTHSVDPASVMALACDMFAAATRGYILAIRGYEFDAFGERLSARAAENLEAAVAHVAALIRSGELLREPPGKVDRRPALALHLTNSDFN
jgi:hydrogenase maturation protease